MTERRNGVYRGFEISADVESHPTGSFHVVALWVRLTSQGALANVPVAGGTSGPFADLDSAFATSFGRIQQAIDHHIDGSPPADSAALQFGGNNGLALVPVIFISTPITRGMQSRRPRARHDVAC